jgi:hypothetical protein
MGRVFLGRAIITRALLLFTDKRVEEEHNLTWVKYRERHSVRTFPTI